MTLQSIMLLKPNTRHKTLLCQEFPESQGFLPKPLHISMIIFHSEMSRRFEEIMGVVCQLHPVTLIRVIRLAGGTQELPAEQSAAAATATQQPGNLPTPLAPSFSHSLFPVLLLSPPTPQPCSLPHPTGDIGPTQHGHTEQYARTPSERGMICWRPSIKSDFLLLWSRQNNTLPYHKNNDWIHWALFLLLVCR